MPSDRDYAERLREEAYKTFSPQIKDLEAELKELSNSLSSGIQQIEQKLEAISHVELPTAEIVVDEILEDVLRQKGQEEESLVLFARDIRRKETQEEILGLLLDYINKFFPRVALFTIRNDRFAGWSSRGYSEESARNIAECSLRRSDCPQFQESLESEDITTAPDMSDDSSLSFLQVESTEARYLVPLYVMQRPVALLYVEKSDGTSSGPNALSILTDLTVLRLENIALNILYALTEETESVTPQPAQEEPEPYETVEPAEEPAEETIEPEPPETVEYTEGIAEPEPSDAAEQTSEQEEEREEPEMEYAEAVPAGPPPIPQVDSEAPEEAEENIPAEETPEPAAETEEATAEAQSQEAAPDIDEEKLHTEAKRFARLLVSEIKLYNENHVVEGRRNNDLYLRLKRDIDKSRDMYEHRVSPIVLQKIDYFHDEIIRILGNNDPSTLGSDYPGPRVES